VPCKCIYLVCNVF